VNEETATINLLFPECSKPGREPCEAWQIMADQRRLSVSQYKALERRLDIRHDPDGGMHDEIDRLTAALHNSEFEVERLKEKHDRFAELYATEGRKNMVLLEELSRLRAEVANYRLLEQARADTERSARRDGETGTEMAGSENGRP
jgi:hypothetical protein